MSEEFVLTGKDPHLEKIDTLFAIIAIENGKEGICSAGPSEETQKPLVFADSNLAERMYEWFTNGVASMPEHQKTRFELRRYRIEEIH